MLKKVLSYGALTGILAGIPMSVTTLVMKLHSLTLGYLILLIALGTVFIAVKRHRDIAQGGVIRFWPAFGLGLGISAVAGVLYVATWDLAQMIAHVDFASDYARSAIAGEQARGASAAEIAKMTAEMEQFKTQYANPLFRWPMIFIEIFPVGVLVSVVSALLLRNSRFLPART